MITAEMMHKWIDTIFDESVERLPIDDFESGPKIVSKDSTDARRTIIWASDGCSTLEEAQAFLLSMPFNERMNRVWRNSVGIALIDLEAIIRRRIDESKQNTRG